ncbi:WG repeat-containing protein [Faucicola boevrei]|uniref:WG repeat-containing protein n=1 Tax=Faucicola boevrei TaxID=346665 RepID=UPI00037F9E8B|nr:WG repeat-containing protein [Moraxella boevrei]
MKNFSKILTLTALLSALSMSAMACELEDDYQLSQGLSFDYYCEFSDDEKNAVALAYRELAKSDDVRYGFVNRQGKLVIPAIFEEANPFSEGLALVYKKDQPMFIDKTGKVAIALTDFDEVHDFSEGYAVSKKDGKWGYLDKKGNFAIEPTYDDAYGFSEGLALVLKDGKYGFINPKNQTVIPFEYDETSHFFYEDGLIYAKKGEKYGIINKKNQVILPFDYDYVDEELFYEDLVLVAKIQGVDDMGEPKYKYGFANRKGKIVIPLKYDSISNFADGYATIIKENGDDYQEIFIDTKGNVINQDY